MSELIIKQGKWTKEAFMDGDKMKWPDEEIITTPDGGWMTKSYVDSIKKFMDKQQKRFLMASITPNWLEIRKERNKATEDNRKWAWIKVANSRTRAWVDNKTMKAYKADGYNPTWIEIKTFTFERWCTSFDL